MVDGARAQGGAQDVTALRIVEDTPDQDVIDALETALEMARAGQLVEVVIVGNVKDADGPGYWRSAAFDDRWRLLGALEYAKDAVHRG